MKKTLLTLANSFRITNAGWMVIPFGEYAHPQGYIQVLNADAAKAMVAVMEAQRSADPEWPGQPITKGHPGEEGFSETDDAAQGWIREAVADVAAGELRLRPEYNEPGAALIANKQYVYFSPVWRARRLDAKRVMPVRLDAVGLTNRPVIKSVRPLANAEPQEGAVRMNELMKLLGLAEDADEAAAIAALNALMQSLTEAKEKVATLEAQVTNLTGEKETLTGATEQLANARKQHASLLLDVATFDGRVTPGARGAWEREFSADHDATAVKLANAKPAINVQSRTLRQAQRSGGESRSSEILTLVNAEKAKGADHRTAYLRVQKARPELFSAS